MDGLDAGAIGRKLPDEASCLWSTIVMPDFMRIGGVTGWLSVAAVAGAAENVHASLSRGGCACHESDANGALAGMAKLGRSSVASALRIKG